MMACYLILGSDKPDIDIRKVNGKTVSVQLGINHVALATILQYLLSQTLRTRWLIILM